MKRGGRPRRSEEQPNSPFGKKLKEYIRRIEDFTQAELSQRAGIPEKTLSEMIKGKRPSSGWALRRDLRNIIRVLYEVGALLTLEEANDLITQIPATAPLDERDPEEKAIIDLFTSPAHETEQIAAPDADDTICPDIIVEPGEEEIEQADPDHEEAVRAQDAVPSDSQDEHATADGVPEPATITLQIIAAPVVRATATRTRSERPRQRRSWWQAASILMMLMVIAGILLAVFLRRSNDCVANTNGVTLYADTNYQGQCHTFGPGDYELARFGLEQNVSSIRDPNAAYHVRLFDKAKNFSDVDKDTPILSAEWDKRADMIHVEKHRPTACHPGTDGIIAFINPDYSGGCLFITQNIPDLTPFNFDKVIVSIQFVGKYQNSRQLVLYKQPDYKDRCGVYWQNQSDLLQCARIALSVRVLPFTPPTPIPTMAGTHTAGNVAEAAMLSPGSAQAVVDGNLQTEWIGGHMRELDLRWAFPVTVHRVVVWDRKQSLTDNNQINKLKLVFSDGTATGSIDMISLGPRCADITFPQKTITWLHIIPVDASGNNGYREVEVWTTTGPQYSNNTCVNKVTIAQTVPQ